MGKPRVLSGIRATGDLHLGNLLGAVRTWVGDQESKDCFYFIADLHGLTEVDQRHDGLGFETLRMSTAATFLACGLDPNKVTVFFQSSIPQHTELMWYLSAVTKKAELERMTQWKDKTSKQVVGGSAGLFSYPVLMASDILLYDADEVPVGDDQKQHVEYTRDWAQRFNSYFGETFHLPSAVIPTEGARIMDLQDPRSKMSKSADSDAGIIFMTDSDDVIAKKVRRAVTDAGSEITYCSKKPGISNLLEIYSALSSIPIAAAEKEFVGAGYGQLKEAVTQSCLDRLRPIRTKAKGFLNDRAELRRQMAIGTSQASTVAEATAIRARAALGVSSL